MHCSLKIVSACAAMIALSLAVPISSTMAQSGGSAASQNNPTYSGAPDPAHPQAVDDMTLQHTARAFVKVRQIAQKERTAVSGTNDKAAKLEAARQAESEKVAAVEAEGLNPKDYNQVLQVVQANTDVQRKFLSYISNFKN